MYQQHSAGVKRLSDGAILPLDAANTDYAAYLAWVAAGNTPAAAEAVPFAVDKDRELGDFRAKREMYLNRLAGIAVAAMIDGDQVVVDAAAAMRQGLLDLPTHPSVTGAATYAALRTAIKAQYAALVAAVPEEAKQAFAKVDA